MSEAWWSVFFYPGWLKRKVTLRHALTCPWPPEAWRDVRQHIA